MAKNQSTIGLDEEEKLVLLAVGALGQPLRSKIKLQKIIFLVSNVIEGLQEDLGYEPHLYGPYSETVENISEDLVSLGYVNQEGSKFSLTPKGREEYKRLKPSKEIIQLIDDFKAFLNDMTDEEVMIYIYSFYPDFIEESTKWDELKKYRVDRSIKLLQREKLSMGKAAAMAGMNSFDFAQYLNNHGVQWR